MDFLGFLQKLNIDVNTLYLDSDRDLSIESLKRLYISRQNLETRLNIRRRKNFTLILDESQGISNPKNLAKLATKSQDIQTALNV